MKLIMKKILLLSFLSVILLSTSCNKLLNEDVRNQISNTYLNTPSGVDDGVRAGYSYLRGWYGQQSAGWLTVFGTDEYTNGNADPTYNNYTANLNASSGVTTGVWNSLYQGVNTCNAVIDAAANVTGMDPILKDTRVAEARFLRAHYYFLLVQTFGPLHLTLHPTVGASTVASRSPIADVYTAIINDLNFAVAHLPATASDYGRVNLAAAKHALAKVYLTRATTTAAQSGDYAAAATLAKDVIATSGAKLLDDFAAIFAQGAGVRNSEVLWSCQFSTNPLTGGSNMAFLYFNNGYEGQPGMTRDLVNGRAYAHYRPTDYMLGLYNKNYDSRFSKTFKTTWFCNKPGTYTINGKSVALKLKDTAVVMLDHEITAAQRNAIRYTVIAPSQYTTGLWPMNSKFQDSLRTSVNSTAGVKDFIIYRLGETYLIAAEALYMSGKPTEALPYVNTLRARAAIVGPTSAITQANINAMQVTVADLSPDFFLDERARELSGEYMRWFDLTRTGKLLERVKKYNPVAAALIKPYHILRPIPQTQIDRTLGGATSFPQNTGY